MSFRKASGGAIRTASVSQDYEQRLDAAKNHRHSSVRAEAIENAMNDGVDVLDADQLSDADRKLAELGYVQVCTHTLT